MESVLHAPLQVVEIAIAQGENQKGRSTNVVGGILSSDGWIQNAAGFRRPSFKVRNEHDQL
jgi:hypothetical protein